MADIVMVNEGKPLILDWMLARVLNTFPDWLLMLWTDSGLSPVPSTVYSDLTEATFTGYSRVTLTKSQWNAPTIVSDVGVCDWGGSTPTWTNSGLTTNVIYGYAVITTSGVILWIQQFDAPINLATGGIMSMTPEIKLDTIP